MIGSRKLKTFDLVFSAADCSGNVCTKTVNLSFTSRTFVYLNYDFLLTSYFIYAKGTSYSDVFKKDGYSTDVSDCYPVSTYSDYFKVMNKLNLPMKNQAVLAGLMAGDQNKKVSPCGLKATLFDYIGSLTITSGFNLVQLNTKDLVRSKYSAYIRAGSDDIVDVNDGRFFGWYMPEVPAFGTILFYGIADQDLSGSFTFKYDKSNIL